MTSDIGANGEATINAAQMGDAIAAGVDADSVIARSLQLPPFERGRVGEGVFNGRCDDPHPTACAFARQSTCPFQGEVGAMLLGRTCRIPT